MGFLDFAPEPPAPSATPVTVTEHVDLSCNPSTDTRDLSSELLVLYFNFFLRLKKKNMIKKSEIFY